MNILNEGVPTIQDEYDSLLLEEAPKEVSSQYLLEKENGTRNANGSLKLKKLTPKHEEMVAMHLDGMRNRDIAESFGVTDATVSIVLHDPLAKAIVQSARQENEARFANLYGKVVDVIEDAVDKNESIDVRLKGANAYFKEAGQAGSAEKETAEDVVQKILNLQVNGNIIIQQGG